MWPCSLTSKKIVQSSHIVLTYIIKQEVITKAFLLSNKEEPTVNICNIMEEPQKWGKEPGTTEDILYDAIYMKFWDRQNEVVVKDIRTTVAWVVVEVRFREWRKVAGKTLWWWDCSVFWWGCGLHRYVQFLKHSTAYLLSVHFTVWKLYFKF